MSILISGIDMPKQGEYKQIYIYDTGEVTAKTYDGEVTVATATQRVLCNECSEAEKMSCIQEGYVYCNEHARVFSEDDWCSFGMPKGDEE